MNLKNLDIDKSWTLFLDRDGVINKKLPGDYVKRWEEFEFLPGVPEAIRDLTEIFGKILIVTNQQGIGKGIMTEMDIEVLHDKMIKELRYEGGIINKVYHSPYLVKEKSVFRKPNPGMARKARIDFPDIDFNKSIMVGDSPSDMGFGKNMDMYTVLIAADGMIPEELKPNTDFVFRSLQVFAKDLKK